MSINLIKAQVEKLDDRLIILETGHMLLLAQITKLTLDTETIIYLLNKTKGVAGFVIKHGPRFIALIVGWFVATEKVDAKFINIIFKIFS